MPEALFRGIVKAGRFVPDDIVKHRGWLAKVEGRRVIESIKREQHARTMSQNRYYWGVVLAVLSEWSGHEAEELHEHLTDKFLAREQRQLPNGEVMTPTARTSVLSIEEFSGYVDRVVRWAAEQGVYVPSADEVNA